jgi:hypothetical protein
MDIKRIVEGLTIIAKYDDAMIDAQHDEIHAGSDSLTEDDAARLEQLEWVPEGDFSWMCFT